MDLSNISGVSETLNQETGCIHPLVLEGKEYFFTLDAMLNMVSKLLALAKELEKKDESENVIRCQRCRSSRILTASSHGRDCHNYSIKDFEGDGYLPRDLGIGGEDDMEITICLDCGQLQGEWPLPKSSIEG